MSSTGKNKGAASAAPAGAPAEPPEVVAHASALASHYRLAVVPLHRATDGRCSCRKGGACKTPGKHPRIRWKERPAEPPTLVEIEHWWAIWPASRVGVILGEQHCALDVDEHGDHGLDELADLEHTFGALPDTWRALTPSGGLHVWFALDGEVASTTHPLRDGVQLRAGRHVMAMPPSDGRTWEVSPSEAELAPLPSWIPAYLREASGDRSSYLPFGTLSRGSRHPSYTAAARSMARAGFGLRAILAALVATDEEAEHPKNDREELERIAGWAYQAQAGEEER
jgi:hypothetical protein